MPVTNLLDPVLKSNTCPLAQERFELRTKTLGCGCSTATFLSVTVTVLSTIVALLTMYAILVCVRSANRVYGTGSRRGWEIEVLDDGSMNGKPCPRARKLTSLFHRKDLSTRSEQEETTERSRLLPSS